MPNYYNPYNFYPATYPAVGQAAFAPYSQPVYQAPQASGAQGQLKAMEWVEGEVGAKAFQMPQGWPANQPIPLWDSTDTNIYLKSWSPMGFPNPLQKLHYTMPDQQVPVALPQTNENNASGAAAPDMSQYVTKDDLDKLRAEIQSMSRNYSGINQNGNSNSGNQNGNRGGSK